MRGGGMAKKAGPVKKKMRGGGMAKKAGPVKMKTMRGGGGMRRNLRDEEARVIGRQDDAADELRRVRARRPKDATERRDKKDEIRRVSARERDARDEMGRLRRKAVGLGMKTGGKAKKKQGYNDRLDESLGMRNRKTTAKKKPAAKKAAPKKAAKKVAKKKTGLSDKINQHKRMAMGENVLTGKMIKKKKGGQTMASRRKESEGMEKSMGRRKYAAVGTMDKGRKKLATGGRTYATTGVKLNMGEPKTKTVQARGRGAAIKGTKFRENT
tara:strand:- start:6 stop:812 length:807 start_codon:yes stop_codon:yes gene_type:complete